MGYKKYELIDSTTSTFEGKTVKRIRALRNFGDVKEGELGGFIENEKNLSHSGECWLYNNSRAYGGARIMGNAKIRHNCIVIGALIKDNAVLLNNVFVKGKTTIKDWAIISGRVKIEGENIIFDHSKVSNNAQILGKVRLGPGKPRIEGNSIIVLRSQIMDNSLVTDNSIIKDNSIVRGSAEIEENATLFENAIVGGDAKVGGYARLGKGAFITEKDEYKVIYPIGNNIITFYKTINSNINVSFNIFNGSIKNFKREILDVSNDIKFVKECTSLISYAKEFLNNKIYYL